MRTQADAPALMRSQDDIALFDAAGHESRFPSFYPPPGVAPFLGFKNTTISAAAVRLQKWMDETLSITSMTEQDRRISEVIAEERSRLRNFIRKRVPNEADVEDLLQEVFYELVASQSPADAD